MQIPSMGAQRRALPIIAANFTSQNHTRPRRYPFNALKTLPPFPLCLIAYALAAASVLPAAWAQEGFERAPEPVMPAPRSTQESDQPTVGTAKSISGQQERRIKMQGEADLQRGPARIRADEIEYFNLEDEVQARGNVRLDRSGDVVLTPELKLKLDTSTGNAKNPQIFYGKVGGRGKGDSLEFLGEDKQRITNVEYTSCKPGDESWLLKASSIELDRDQQVAEARRATVVFKGLPILGTPYMSFPLGNERRSGFLPPSLGLTSRTGIDVTVPYYVDIAPNRDFTLEPRLMTKRGLLLGGIYRYLEPNYKGEVRAEWLPKDQDTREARGAFNAQHNWGSGVWSGGWNLQYVSDDTYFADLAKTVTNVATSYLPREAWLSYGYARGAATLRVTTAQNLFDALAGARAVNYERVPQFNWTYARPGWHNFDLQANVDLTQFRYPSLRDGKFLDSPIDVDKGLRAVINPSVSYPVVAPGYFFTPRLSVHATQYSSITGGPGGPGSAAYAGPRSASRVLPLASADAGLIFERDEGIFASNLKQTLEPRLYYLYVPFKDQKNLPNFDSAITDFSFAQIFSENVFAGNDRIADADHLTFALTTRYVRPDSGEERLRLSIAKRQYFTQQRVDLPGAAIPVGESSDLLFSIGGSFGRAWSLDSTVQLNSDDNSVVRSSVGVRYNPSPRNVINLAYRLARQVSPRQEQVDFSTQWRLGSRWYTLARVNYAARERRVAEALAGFEYDANCWVARIVASRFSTLTQKSTTSVFFQLELNGLGSLGNNPIDTIRRNVPGYRKLEAPQPWTFDSY
jgi:LPS-assembly protein